MSEERAEATINLRNPHRSRIHKLINSLSKPKPFDLVNLKYGGHLDPLTRETGEFLLGCIYGTARLNGFGHLMVKDFFKEVLQNQYQINRRFERGSFAPIKDPVFILGLPRTGSTFLFNLLGATGRFRTLKNWETHKPASGKPKFLKRAKAAFLLRVQHHFAPGLRTIHEQRLEGPEECTKMLLNSFVSQMFPGLFQIPKYNDFLETADFLPTYELFYKQLQILGDHDQRWLLKSPIHIQSLDNLLEVFPDAKFVHLNRDFDQVLGSICSLAAAFRCMTCDSPDGKEIGAEVKKFLARDLAKSQKILDAIPQKTLPIQYHEFVADPTGTARKIFDFVGVEYVQEVEDRIEEERKISIPNKFGKHVYRLEDYF